MRHDLVIVGGGITGCEAAYATARAGLSTLLVTTSLDTLYALAHDVYELDVPGGSLLAACVGRSGAVRVRAPEVRRAAKRLLEAEPRVHLLQSTASRLMVENGVVAGVDTWEGIARHGALVALCVGSFLGARLTVGASEEHAGRLSEMAYDDLLHDLVGRGFEFQDEELALDGLAGALPYVVRFRVLARREWAEATYRLGRSEGLYAAGACVGRFGYAAAVTDGMALGSVLVGAFSASAGRQPRCS